MSRIPLGKKTISAYCGGNRYNACQDISSIHVQYDVDEGFAKVEASIPATTSRQGFYQILVKVRPDGRRIKATSCTCPVGYKCKHIHKVLCRISQSPQNPIPGPSREHREREARRQRLADQMEHASVYIALACKSELDSGSDFRRSYFVKDNFDQQILGVFFSKKEANRCAKNFLEWDDDEEDMEEDESMDSDDEETFVYDGSDDGDYDEENAFQKVWVEQRAIEDASPRFHK